MKRLIFICSCFLASLVLPLQSAESAGRQATMLYFYQDGCPWCARMNSVLRDAEVSSLLARYNRIVRVNVNENRNIPGLNASGEALVKKFRVKATPTILFIDQAGKIFLTIPGALRKKDFLDVVCTYQVAMKEDAVCRNRGD